ncbi:hypothetical protein [Gimesia maris]|uniref:hypothetical protein n=1 Tax=Gimesia maris TaxID=122 RepID=UPI001E4E8A5D|nr:hypothetical protein [Gimesia maris]
MFFDYFVFCHSTRFNVSRSKLDEIVNQLAQENDFSLLNQSDSGQPVSQSIVNRCQPAGCNIVQGMTGHFRRYQALNANLGCFCCFHCGFAETNRTPFFI